MKARFVFLVTAGLIPALTGCGVAIRSRASFAEGADLRGGLTFGWNQVDDRVNGDPRLQGNRFFEDRLHEAIEWQLSLRGIHHDESSPDLLVHHHLSLEDHEMVAEVTDPSGSTTTSVDSYEQGTVMVHIVDNGHKKDLWVAWAQADIDVALRSPDNMRNWVNDLVTEMFKDWPVMERMPPRP
jgi:hypothetical protein